MLPPMNPGGMDPQLWEAYAAAWVEVDLGRGTFVFPPVSRGRPPRLPTLLVPDGFVITACNPRSVPLSEAENRERNDALSSELAARRWTRFRAVGHDGEGSWREPSFAVVGAPAVEILALAHQFSQNAIYEWGPGLWRIVVTTPLE